MSDASAPDPAITGAVHQTLGGAGAGRGDTADSLTRASRRTAGASLLTGIDFADPTVLITRDATVLYSTNVADVDVQTGAIGASGELTTGGDALVEPPAWSESGWVWAPSVSQLRSDAFLMYYSTLDVRSGKQCISTATSTTANGPFTDDSTEPLVCQLDLGGSIDPDTITKGTKTYLIWKSDGNCCGKTTTIWIARLSADGRSLVESPAPLISSDQAWEHGVVEAPSMIEHNGRYYLFYSGGRWDTASYATGYAICESVFGPCTKPSATPILTSSSDFSGPGGADIFVAGDQTLHVVYHAWIDGIGYSSGARRGLFVAPLGFDKDRPVIGS